MKRRKDEKKQKKMSENEEARENWNEEMEDNGKAREIIKNFVDWDFRASKYIFRDRIHFVKNRKSVK